MIKASSIFYRTGVLLLVFSLLLAIYNIYNDNNAKKVSEEVAQKLFEDISIADESWEHSNLPYDEMEIPVMEIDGATYIGILQIPDLGLILPVAKDWSYPKLKNSPCRYSGSQYQDNLVIMAHNYASHFGKLQRLTYGKSVVFTDIEGNVFNYEVTDIETLEPTSVEQVKEGLGDLTLFTCTLGGKFRVCIGCERIL